MKVLVPSILGDRFHQLFEVAVANRLRDSGVEVVVYGCPGNLSYCPALDNALRVKKQFPPPFNFLNKLRRFISCKRCISRTDRIWSRFGFTVKTLKAKAPDYARPGADQHHEQFNSVKLPRGVIKESPVERHISCIMVSRREEYPGVLSIEAVESFIAARDFWSNYSSAVFEIEKPDAQLLFNGRILPFACFLDQAISSEVASYVHDRGWEDGSYVVKYNEPVHKRGRFKAALDPLLGSARSSVNTRDIQGMNRWVSDFFRMRLKGKNLDCRSVAYPERLDTPQAGEQVTEKVVSIFLTTPDEITPGDPEFELLLLQWDLVPKVVNWIRRCWDEDLRNLIIEIRLHPNFTRRGGVPIAHLDEKLRKLVSQLGDRERITGLTVQEPPVEVFMRSAVVLSFGSSAALEAEFLGVPSVVPHDHIFALGCTNSVDLRYTLAQKTCVPFTVRRTVDRERLNLFAFLFFYVLTMRFKSITYTNYDKVIFSDLEKDSSRDMGILLSSIQNLQDPNKEKLNQLLSHSKFS